MRDDARSVADDASVRSSWIWALGAAFEDASDDDTRANARERTVGETRAETRGRSTRARRRVETREETSTNPRHAMDHRARARGDEVDRSGAHWGLLDELERERRRRRRRRASTERETAASTEGAISAAPSR